MASANELTIAERRLIKGMLLLWPQLNYQEILAYFTYPGRDINHARILEIHHEIYFADLTPATQDEVFAFINAWSTNPRPDPDQCVTSPCTGADNSTVKASRQVGSLLLNWWPVGQGLYSSGLIRTASGASFNWVYDCGTASSLSFIDKAVAKDQVLRDNAGATKIDLAVLSHFDKDHINGFTRLVATSSIERLLLPYLPLWKRLVLAIMEGIATEDPEFLFFLNPTAYLRAIEGAQITDIVFVPPSEPDDAAEETEEPDLPLPPEGEDGLREWPPIGSLKAETAAPPPDTSGDPAVEVAEKGTEPVFLARGGRILSPGFWEFVPYNDAEKASLADASFVAKAQPLLDTLKDDENGRKQAFKDLKSLYEATFGSSDEDKNTISLFLYSGPLGRRLELGNVLASHQVERPAIYRRFAQIHTGDATLNDVKSAYYTRFRDFFIKNKRLEKLGPFQVMHHGSRFQWHDGIARKLRPTVSIFSSDPLRNPFYHPHMEVLRDFWLYHPVQVDKVTGFQLAGRIMLI